MDCTKKENLLHLTDATQEIEKIVLFLRQTYKKNKKNKAVIGVSGGIDSALVLSLLVRALTPHSVYPVLLPYGTQDMTDGQAICTWNAIPKNQWLTHDIKPLVENICSMRGIGTKEKTRRGNCMARTRMILLFDIAKQYDALVCGTENRSEKELGYFTRFGDAASDIEPLEHLWKTQVGQLAEVIGIPEKIRKKEPTAGLWEGQTDEEEIGFSYAEADNILSVLLDGHRSMQEMYRQFSQPLVKRILDYRDAQRFKQETPYRCNTNKDSFSKP